MNPRLRTLIAIGSTVTVAATLITMTPAHASAELDQEAPLPVPAGGLGSGVSSSVDTAQSFTAGISGNLTKVGLGVSKQGTVTNLTVEISDVAGDAPDGLALSSTTVTNFSDMPTGATTDMFYVNLDSPVPVQEGSKYAISLTTTDAYNSFNSPPTGGDFYWYEASSNYGAGAISQKISGSSAWTTYGWVDRAFETYVAVIPAEPSSSSAGPQAPPAQLSVQLTGGTVCRASQATSQGPWVSLPSAGDCTPPAAQPDANLLGWATTPDFPVAIAQRQVDNGWGAYETYGDNGQLTAVFIPAGGATLMTNDTNLFPIWR